MFRITAALLIVLFALPAFAENTVSKPKCKTASKKHGKLMAPVVINAQLAGNAASVTVRFNSAGKDLEINVSGVDGLHVTSTPLPVSGAEVVKGETTTFDVTFVPGTGQSHLVVAVTGKFNGATRSSVQSFAVGSPTVEQQKPVGTTKTDSSGQRIKVMPGE